MAGARGELSGQLPLDSDSDIADEHSARNLSAAETPDQLPLSDEDSSADKDTRSIPENMLGTGAASSQNVVGDEDHGVQETQEAEQPAIVEQSLRARQGRKDALMLEALEEAQRLVAKKVAKRSIASADNLVVASREVARPTDPRSLDLRATPMHLQDTSFEPPRIVGGFRVKSLVEDALVSAKESGLASKSPWNGGLHTLCDVHRTSLKSHPRSDILVVGRQHSWNDQVRVVVAERGGVGHRRCIREEVEDRLGCCMAARRQRLRLSSGLRYASSSVTEGSFPFAGFS